MLFRPLTLPSALYRADRFFYLGYDLPYLAVFGAGIVLMRLERWPGVVVSWQSWMWWLLPPLVYLHVLASVCIHNATHRNFPRAINRIIGELLGVLLVVRFANWEILHVRHHRYPDDPARDPHPMQPSFWRFMLEMMLVNLERQLQHIHYDQFGDTVQTRRYERFRSLLSFSCEAACVASWYYLLGPAVFFRLFVPMQLLGWIVVSHFNWRTHDAEATNGDYKPINLDRGLYWLGNRIWFGLYMHENHHRRASVFNPLRLEQVTRRMHARRAIASD
ncbi:MAG: uncharacterized protein JWN04_1088 [Myxococcaceae bacterium]|nr:uncharacterized protein [Myxococcaceae bacterium]